uniref:BRK domain-containing protein n=2 Tax=Rhodosorus marinus TaxID=101924 RepID=A0A7S0BDH8_9RHOD|mmetsp:Transcript_10546/g.15277  ORF Transcript_10546/g.15277 Transcript_10546/m.15277 type:complete len:382 (+) Transcript_10546:138-1283(+)
MSGLSRSAPSVPIVAVGTGTAAPFSILLFRGVAQEDEHVTVWEPRTGKTVAGNAAPYRKNLKGWLTQHPGWEEKADELKSSKRRSAVRRQRSISAAFAAMCFHAGDIVKTILNDIEGRLKVAGYPSDNADVDWTAEEDSRLKELIVLLAEKLYSSNGTDHAVSSEQEWEQIQSGLGSRWKEFQILRRARELLITDLRSHGGKSGQSSPRDVGSPRDDQVDTCGLSLSSTLSYLERHLATPREPRITVWEPATGRTVSGNAAPCRRNLEAWIKAHPGWEPKSEDQLTSIRRQKGRRNSPMAVDESPITASTPDLNDVLDAMMLLGKSPLQSSHVENSGHESHIETTSSDTEMEDAERFSEDNSSMDSNPPPLARTSPVSIPI